MTDIEFLFRYRDLVAPTIQQHREIFMKKEWCWWGWWKRPSEDGRADIWKKLAKQTAGNKPVAVGLFDSGSGKVHKAEVVGVIPAEENDSENVIRVPESEKEHVPLYYRESPFSRAWIKLSGIEDAPIQFFGNYSFAEAPSLPNYTEATLKQFKNKKIVNADELRGMDTTIWRVRPRSHQPS